jgi:hypothetical protein
MRIINKGESYKLYESGAFGNKLRTWNTLDDLLADRYGGNVTMRYAGGYNKWCEYNIPQIMIPLKMEEWKKQGADILLVRFNETAPDDRLIIQGEFGEDKDYGYILSYSTDKGKSNREAMKSPLSAVGRDAKLILGKHLSMQSRRNMYRLLELYPYAIVEFSTYDTFLGDIPGNNTIFWEVRNY